MIPELETLYSQAIEMSSLTHWLQNEDFVKDYEDSARYAKEEEKRLLSALMGDDLEQFRRYMDNRAAQEDLESQMIFSKGLSMGIRLGSLAAWC